MEKEKTSIEEKEIEYWSTHQDLDKFNYSNVSSNILTFIVILVAVLSITSNLEVKGWVVWFKIIVLLFLWIVILYSLRALKKEPEKHNISFIAREEMIKYRYGKLGVKKEKLEIEFEDLKKIIEETKKNSKCREARIEKYYNDKEKNE